MTETVSGSAARRGKGGRKGLKIERIFTTPGVHPYDELRWERRDVVMTNWRDGSVNFEQRGVEFPDFWSVNAVNIVTSKYFRGAVGTPRREWSLKQLIDRVAQKYVDTGRAHGYFAADADAEIFEHELKYALAHQMFAFNSPVWFNVGTESPQQVSACLAYDSLVSTPAGLIPIGRLVEEDAVGTKVYDAQGVTRILATKANGVKDVLRIHTKAGYTLDVTADHLVWKASDDEYGAFVEAGELKAGDRLEWHRRDSYGEAEITAREIAEAALAGWLQSGGFVGQYEHGNNRSLTIEATTVTEAELDWVSRQLDIVFPDVHRHESIVETQDKGPDRRRTRLYGAVLEDFVEAWGLRARGTDMTVPQRLFTAPLPVVAAYLRSVFQAEGSVSERKSSTVVEVDMISEGLIRGMQRLLLRFGIYSQVGVEKPNRPDQKPGWTLHIQTACDRRAFCDEIGFIDPVKSLKPHEGFAEPGPAAKATKRLEIARIVNLGPMEVYDIQTESGEFLTDNIRVHNCFILSVDDTMESILEWYKEEGVIFKGGSGAGLNLSRIRSSKELLSSGGTASGPVSFMRGADASAGTIKSGGATRRAAKMVVLDVDHPDVAEFIETKAREENKIRALRDAGFDMDLGGRDIASVQYQNANNSVRVSDVFMRAVESGGDFDLRARLTNDVVETVKAKDLFRLMAKAAWECADPGIQYDDTINDWHTNPETGRITASNPCFPADQRVVTDRGLVRIGDMVGQAAHGETFGIYTNDVTSETDAQDRIVATDPVRYMVTGTNEILELRFSDGFRLRCTPGHRIWTENRGWVQADELTEEDRVARSFHRADRAAATGEMPTAALRAAGAAASDRALELPEKWDEEFAHYLGWLVGDGRLTDTGAVTVYGNAEDIDEVLPRHRELLRKITGSEGEPSVQADGTVRLPVGHAAFRAFLKGLGVSTGQEVPDAVYEAPEAELLAFLRGLFDADGSVVHQNQDTRYVGLGSPSEELLIGVQEILASLGIASRIHGGEATCGSEGPGYDLRISGHSMLWFATLIGFGPKRKGDRLQRVLEIASRHRGHGTAHLVSRESRGFETTYNLTEPRNHSYIVGGVIVRNCSEYMSLDNSSCNLASINLIKFLREDGTFDVAKFVRLTELVITAMDISITFADFPTKKIAQITRDYRQLGIGYANLGALLMATGHAYDSEGGRSLAAALTSLMTGVAYRRSAELAGVVGTYEGYARNADAHKRVMRKHAAANDEIRTLDEMDKAIHAAAAKQWKNCLEYGEKNGYRNAQSSLLAPTGTIGLMMDCDTTGIEPDLALVKFKKLVGGGSMQIVNHTVPRALRKLGYQDEQVEAIVEYISEYGHVIDAPGLRPEHYEVFDCAMGERAISPMGHVRMMAATQPFLSGAISKCVTGDTLVATAEGLTRIGSLYQGEAEDTFRPEKLVISSLDGDRKTDAFYYGGVRPVRRVVLGSGHTVTGTYPHRLLTAGDGGLIWKSLGEIEEGDPVAVQYGAEMWSTVPASLRHIEVPAAYGDQQEITLPDEMTEDLAFLLGAYAAEGHTVRGDWSVVITNTVPEVLRRIRRAWHSVFGITARITEQPGRRPGVVVSSKALVEFLDGLGCGTRASNKRIPDAVLRSPREMVIAFLRGLALDAYVTTSTAPKWAICLDSPRLLDDLQAILTNLGVVHGRVSKYDAERDKLCGEVYAAGLQGKSLVSMVPFLEPDKAARAAKYLSMDSASAHDTADVIPGITPRELYELIPEDGSGPNGVPGRRPAFAFLRDPRTQHVTRRTVERVSTLPGVVLPGWLRQVIDGRLHFSPVESVGDAGEVEVFDLSVPETHAFVANGIMNHNTVNMPEQATIEDIEKVYFEGWKLGLKALAIYRDNCKVGQPLSVAKRKQEARPAEVPAEATRPVRKRLPKQRPATVTRFSVAGAEGYMTASSYPDDGVGEVFLKLGKQGSTLAGVMDAFSMAISISLQYGVPLETWVEKFTNMRFEPAGMTDDPDIRMATSVMDYIFRRLALDHLPYEARAEMGILSAKERAMQVNGEDPASLHDDDQLRENLAQSAEITRPAAPREVAAPAAAPEAHSSMEVIESRQGRTADAPLCLTCGTKMRPAGSCYVCEGCGSTSGCS